MSWQPIVVGVDASPEAAGAAAFAFRMSQQAGTTCHLVHAARDVWASVGVEEGVDALWHALIDQARANITATQKNVVPKELTDDMTVRLGRAHLVLKEAVRELGAELVVLGGKHHSALGRWLGGSTSLNVTRTTEVPLLVVAGSLTVIRRVLVAVDGSAASRPTLDAASRYAALFGAELRALSVLEPLPVVPGVTAPDATDYYRMLEELLKRDVWPLIRTPGAERLVRYGMAVETLLREATAWQAGPLGGGAHRRGWGGRGLLGGVGGRFIYHPPTPPLRVAAGPPAAG